MQYYVTLVNYTFKLEIRLGNDAMQTHDDIANALEEVATKVHNGCTHGYVRDINGNTVGDFSVSAEL